MEIDPICPVCNRTDEDGAHLFLKCKVAKTSWREMQMNDIREKLLKNQDSIQFIMEITQLEKKTETEDPWTNLVVMAIQEQNSSR